MGLLRLFLKIRQAIALQKSMPTPTPSQPQVEQPQQVIHEAEVKMRPLGLLR